MIICLNLLKTNFFFIFKNFIITTLLILSSFAITQGQTTTTLTNTTQIVFNTTGQPVPSNTNITFFALTDVVSKVTITLNNFSHSFPDDVDLLLVSPTGANVIFMSDVGGGNGINNATLIFDDAATTLLPNSTQIFPGTYKPTDFTLGDTFSAPAPAGPFGTTLSVFNGSNPNGTWSLYAADDVSGDTGAIAGGWTLSITTAPVTATSVSITGRALTPNGRGATNTLVSMTDQNGTTRTTITSPFGYFRFVGVEVGQNYVFNLFSKQFQFTPQVLYLSEDISDLNFIGQ